jgi:hypothetical protein
MTAQEAYKTFNKIHSKFEEIRTIYSHLKADIDVMSDSQIKSQVTKILNRISKIDLDLISDCVESLSKYLIYDDVKKQSYQISADIDEIKNFIYSLKGTKKEAILEPNDEDELEKSTPLDKKVDYIRGKFNFLQKEMDSSDTPTIIRDAKRLENTLARLNFEDLPEGEYEEMVDIKNNVSKMIRSLQGVEKSEKYGPYILTPLVDLIAHNITLGNEEKAKEKAAAILNFIEDPERIDMFEPAIKRIIAKKMTPKEFKTFYQSITSMMTGEKKFESFKNYKDRYEFLYII